MVGRSAPTPSRRRASPTDEQIVFAPHLYAESITVDRKVGIATVSIEQGFDAAARTAARYGAPLWVGRVGLVRRARRGPPAGSSASPRQEDERLPIGGAWWVWRQACGDPHIVGYSRRAPAR